MTGTINKGDVIIFTKKINISDVDKKDIIGNVNYRIFPLNKINKVK